MKISSWLPGCFLAAAVFCAASGSASASPREACSALSLADVRGLVGAQVSVFQQASFGPTKHTDSTISNCTYVVLGANGHPALGRSAKVTLMWAPKARLAEANKTYLQRRMEASALKGDTLVLAWVGDPSRGAEGDWEASQKLLAAVLKKL